MTEHLPAENYKLKNRLNESIATGSIFHAYIFVSEHREAAEHFAKDFIKAILTQGKIDDAEVRNRDVSQQGPGTNTYGEEVSKKEAIVFAKVDEDRHEDVIVIRKDGASTKIGQIRAMQERISVRPIGERHVVIIADGDDMATEAQNALLKTLEEPPGNTVIIILSENRENLLPTVRSRSIICALDEEKDETSQVISEAAGQLVELAESGAPYYRMKMAIAPVGETREEIRRLIDTVEELCRDRLFTRDGNGVPVDKEKSIVTIRALEEARNKLGRGISPKYTIKELLLRIGG